MKQKSGYVNRRGGMSGRPGFSLAELMIAIGILGIGMLMVASTFPVGIEQTRRVTNDTMGPIIANEAFAMMEMLLKDTGKRVAVDVDATGTIEQGEWKRLADQLKAWPRANLANQPAMKWVVGDVIVDSTVNPFLRFNLGLWLLDQREQIDSRGYLQACGAPSPCPAVNYMKYDPNGIEIKKYPFAPLAAVYPSQLPTPDGRGGNWPPSLANYPYYWSVLYRFPAAHENGGAVEPSSLKDLDLYVFVNRRGPVGYDSGGLHGLPVWFNIKKIAIDQNTTILRVEENSSGIYYPSRNSLEIASYLDRGLQLVRVDNGNICTIREIFTDSNKAWLDIEGEGSIGVDDTVTFWTIWRDPSTGVSPTIGVFKRTLQLD